MLPLQLGEQRREDIQHDGHAAEHANLPAEGLLAVGDAGNRVLEILKDAIRQLQQGLAGRRNADAAADTQKYRLLQLIFEQENLPADGRLGHVEFVSGRGE